MGHPAAIVVKICPVHSNRKEISDCSCRFARLHPETAGSAGSMKKRGSHIRRSIWQHHYDIFKSKRHDKRYYKGMPFFDPWNPDKGGSFDGGEQWLLEHIGDKPTLNSSLHIIRHELGFVPGNICWATPQVQNQEQLFKRLAYLEMEVKILDKVRQLVSPDSQEQA